VVEEALTLVVLVVLAVVQHQVRGQHQLVLEQRTLVAEAQVLVLNTHLLSLAVLVDLV
jgi:hypothetical protein